MVTIGFNGTYSVREDAGNISISVFVLMNSLARDVEVTLSTLDDTAKGGFCTITYLCGSILTIFQYLPVCSWHGLHFCISKSDI